MDGNRQFQQDTVNEPYGDPLNVRIGDTYTFTHLYGFSYAKPVVDCVSN